MNIKEAIETLTEYRKEHHSFSTDRIGKAMALGIEALRFVKSYEDNDLISHNPILSGETEE